MRRKALISINAERMNWRTLKWSLRSFTSSPETCRWRRLRIPGLVRIISTTPFPSGRRQRAEFPLTPVNSRRRAIRSRICMRTWRQSRRRAPRMITFCVSCVTCRRWRTRFVSCVHARWCITRDSVKQRVVIQAK